jgi:hypothetical protein
MTIKFISSNYTQELMARATNESFIVNWLREEKEPEPIKFFINQTNYKE